MSAAPKQVSVNFNLQFPLNDGRTLVQGPLTYDTDGLYTNHNADFLKDPRFQEAYSLGIHTGHHFREKPEDLHIEWRVHILLWAARHAASLPGEGGGLPGDFVECGVNTGIYSRAICHDLSFEKMTDRRFFLLDTYNGIPVHQLSEGEKKVGLQHINRRYFDCVDVVRENFRGYPNVVIIKGEIPGTLSQADTQKVAYLSIDMNAALPEIAAIEYFWPRMVPGGVVVLDDYGFPNHFHQKHAMDQWAHRTGVNIMNCPTGQGIILKTA